MGVETTPKYLVSLHSMALR